MSRFFNFDSNVQVVKCYIVNDSEYNATIRTKICQVDDSYSKGCDDWVRKYSLYSKTNWIVRCTFPNKQMYVYRKDYICQHSSKNKSHNSDLTRLRDKNCSASIKIVVKKNTVNTQRKDQYMRQGLDTEIKVVFVHTHRVYNAEAYSYLRVSKEVRENFITYFNGGMTPAAAKTYHEVQLTSSIDDADNMECIKQLANAQINPTDRQIYQLFETWRSTHFGDRSDTGVYKILLEKKSMFEENGGFIEIEENPLTIAIVTPIMKRAHSYSFSKDIVFVDSSSSCDQGNSTITFFFGASKVGGIPLGVVIHKQQTKEDYLRAFSLLKKCLGKIAFYGQLQPSLFMTDDSFAERQALKAAFPASTLLLCAFHVCQALWRWLWESKHQIEKSERQAKMLKFRTVVFSHDEVEAKRGMDELCNDDHEQFSKHMKSLRSRMNEWAICYRQTYSTYGHNTNNIIESSIRIFKDVVLERCKAFNAAALVDFIFKVLENYHKRRLIKFASYRITKPEIQYNSFCNKANDLKVIQIDNTSYKVSSHSNNDLYYTVKVYDGFEHCECAFGQGGKFCKHICAIQLNGFNIENVVNLSTKHRIELGNLAIGKDFDHTFMEPMDLANDIDSTNNSKRKKTSEENMSTFFNSMLPTDESITEHETQNMENNDYEQHLNLEINVLQNNIDRIKNIAQSNPNSLMLKNIKQFNKQLEKITSLSDLVDFNFNKLRRANLIGTQPTSRSRRKRLITSGAKRIQAGRPSSNEQNFKQRKKQKVRSLGKNLLNNLPHAKSH